jgi:hypothetical protein
MKNDEMFTLIVIFTFKPRLIILQNLYIPFTLLTYFLKFYIYQNLVDILNLQNIGKN